MSKFFVIDEKIAIIDNKGVKTYNACAQHTSLNYHYSCVQDFIALLSAD